MRNGFRKSIFMTAVCSIVCSFTLTVQARGVHTPRVAGILSAKSTYWQEMLHGIEDSCMEQNLSFFYLDISLQDKDAMTWSAQDAWKLVLLSDVDVIIADGNLPDTEVVEEARRQGMKVVLVDSDAGKEFRDAYVGTDNVQAGYLAVQALDELYGVSSGPVMIQKNETITAVFERFCGICGALKDKWPDVAIKSPEIPWYSERVSNFSLEDFILKNEDIQAVFGLMESETVLYAQVLRQTGLEENVHLITFDLSNEILELLEEGIVDVAIVQKSYEIGYQSAQIAGQLAKGEQLENDTVYIDCAVISQSNLSFVDREAM